MKLAIKIGDYRDGRPAFLHWKNGSAVTMWSHGWRRVYGSRSEAKRDLRRCGIFGAKIVEVKP